MPGQLRDPAAYITHELNRRQRLGQLIGTPVTHMPDDRVDTTGSRYRTMLQRRADHNAPTWDHYAGKLRDDLRRRLTERHLPGDRQPRAEYRPVLREPREDFVRDLQQHGRLPDAEPRDLSGAPALSAGANTTTLAVDEEALGWLVQLREQRETERACAALAAELDNWEYEQGLR